MKVVEAACIICSSATESQLLLSQTNNIALIPDRCMKKSPLPAAALLVKGDNRGTTFIGRFFPSQFKPQLCVS
jgi:hypothetical protein